MKPRYRSRGFLRGALLVVVGAGAADEGGIVPVRDALPGEIVRVEGKPLLQSRGGVFLLDRRRVQRL